MISARVRSCIAISVLLCHQTWANNVIEKEALTPPLFHKVATEQRIPASILYAIVLAESQTSTVKQGQPWPWTINHAGTPHFFPDKVDAIIYARSLLSDQDVNFDVGLGQVNWKFHSRKFKDLSQAFDPYINLSVAGAFLRTQFDRRECVGWKGAIGCYHRPNQRNNTHKLRARDYTQRVMKIWHTLEKRGK